MKAFSLKVSNLNYDEATLLSISMGVCMVGIVLYGCVGLFVIMWVCVCVGFLLYGCVGFF